MTHEPKPSPLLADASTPDDVRSLLTFARDQGPSQADLDRLAKRLSPMVGVAMADLSTPLSDLGTAPANPVGINPALAAAGKGATKLTLSFMGKALVAAGIVSVGAIWWAGSSTPARTLPSAPKPVSAVQSPAVQALPSEPVAAPVIAEPKIQELSTKAEASRRTRRVLPKPVEAPVEVPSEIELIRRAEALRGQPEKLLQSLSEHTRLYPDGMLAQEREVLAIEALLASGQRAAAEARAARLAVQHPGSAHLRRVRVLLGAGSAE